MPNAMMLTIQHVKNASIFILIAFRQAHQKEDLLKDGVLLVRYTGGQSINYSMHVGTKKPLKKDLNVLQEG